MSVLQDQSFMLSSNRTPTIRNSTLTYSPKLSEEKRHILNNNSSNVTNHDSIKHEENPTHFLELNNTNYDSDIKLIKVKIIVPKGTLTNSKFDHKSNVLTVMNDIDKIAFNVRATVEHSSDIWKIHNAINSENNQIESEDTEGSNQKNVNTKPKNNYPKMGTNALLVKTHSVKNTEPKLEQSSKRDSAIIQELVTERYQDNMIELYQRSFIRQTSRRSSLKTDSRTTSEHSVDKDINYQFVNNIKHSSTMLNERDENYGSLKDFHTSESPNLEYGSVVDTLEHFEDVEVTEPTATNITTTCQNAQDTSFNCNDLHVDVTLGSAIDFILTTNGNQLNTSSSREMTYSAKDSVNSQSRSDFDEDKFLQRALGEELNGYASPTMDDKLLGRTESAEMQTNDISYVSSRSVNSSDVSLLLSKASSLYSTFSSKIHHLGKRLPRPSSEVISEESDVGSVHKSPELQANDRMTRLMQESVAQYQIMMQTSKALTYCRSVKEFVGGLEQIEAERMLLLATCKRQSILDAICKYDYEDDDQQRNSQGTITISNLVFHPQESAIQVLSNNVVKSGSGRFKRTAQENSENQWFVCIVNCNEFTYATQATMQEKDGFVRFGDAKIQFEDLATDFDLKVSLYAIKVQNGLKSYSHESKYHLKKDTNKTHSILCPPAPSASFLHHLSLSRSPPSGNPSPAATTKQSFVPFGSSTLRLNNLIQSNKHSNSNSLGNSNYYRLNKMPATATSQLSGLFGADVKTALVVTVNGSGFLTIGLGDQVTAWSRHWCELIGNELKWWNYPQVEGVKRTEALGSIDLRKCITARITSVDRNICARPRTLLVETSSNCEDKVHRYLIACDNVQEMTVWEKKLNTVIGILRSWYAMDNRSSKKIVV